jgi:hypothetical protein
MTETLVGVNPARKAAEHPPGEAERAVVRELVKAARARGASITGPDGLLKTITATVLESALEWGCPRMQVQRRPEDETCEVLRGGGV